MLTIVTIVTTNNTVESSPLIWHDWLMLFPGLCGFYYPSRGSADSQIVFDFCFRSAFFSPSWQNSRGGNLPFKLEGDSDGESTSSRVGFYQCPPDKWSPFQKDVFKCTSLARRHQECLHCVNVWIHSVLKTVLRGQLHWTESIYCQHLCGCFLKGTLSQGGGDSTNKEKVWCTNKATLTQNTTIQTCKDKCFFDLHGMIFANSHTTVKSKQTSEWRHSVEASQHNK